MRGNVRQKMVEGAAEVLSRRGLHATAFSEVLALTGTSRGSIYHHFPGGKAELIEAVLDSCSQRVDEQLRALHGQPPAAVIEGALGVWRGLLVRNDCESGCPVAAVTVAADSTRLTRDCHEAFAQWQATLASALQAGGVAATRASAFAALLLAAVQGALLLSRASGDLAPFDSVAGQLRQQVLSLQA